MTRTRTCNSPVILGDACAQPCARPGKLWGNPHAPGCQVQERCNQGRYMLQT